VTERRAQASLKSKVSRAVKNTSLLEAEERGERTHCIIGFGNLQPNANKPEM
jgi:hypothetical protein